MIILPTRQAIQAPKVNAVKSNLIALDNFNRADSVSSLGNADTGQAWSALVGTWGISLNTAYASALSLSFAKAVIETGLPNCIITVKLSATSSNYGRLIFRVSDALNEWILANNTSGYLSLSKRVNGTSIQVAENQNYSVVNGSILTVIVQGDNIKGYFNDMPVFDVTDSFNNTATKHGLQVYSNTSPRFDNFKVEEL